MMKPNSTDWPTQYIGDPWVRYHHDCWAFVRRVWHEVFGLDVPSVDVDALSALSVRRVLSNHAELQNWEKIQGPVEGCGVLMSQGKRASHVGIWADSDYGGVLHCVKGRGVIFTTIPATVNMGYNILGYYRRQA